MLLVTLHGGKPEKTRTRTISMPTTKMAARLVLRLDDTEGVILDELRGIQLFGKYLYVVNANKEQECRALLSGFGYELSIRRKVRLAGHLQGNPASV